MSKIHNIHLNFNAGEFSPELDGRVDLAKYQNAAKILENFTVEPYGPAVRRLGTRFVKEVKFSSKATGIFPFRFSTIQAYIIEVGDFYFRFYKDNGNIEVTGVPVEVVTPYASTEIFDIQFAQKADVLYLVHPSHAPRKLSRTSHTDWTLTQIDFQPPPTFEADTDLATTLTLAATSGLGVTFTAGVAVFLEGDIDREIVSGSGRGIIRTVIGVTPATQVTVDIVSAFATVGPIASGSWFTTLSPATSLTPDKIGPLHGIATLTLSAKGWRSADVGKYVLINGGVVKILAFTSETVVTAEVLSILNSTSVAIGGTWSLETEDWTSARGYPEAVGFHEQKLWFLGTKSNPQTFWGSSSGLYEVMALGPDDNDAVKYLIASNQVNTIRWMQSSKIMVIGTAGAILKASAVNNGAITPSSISVRPETSPGVSRAISLSVNNAALYIQDSKRRLIQIIFKTAEDTKPVDLLLFANHLTEAATLERIAYQSTPCPYVWGIRSDGVLLGCTYSPDQDVTGWHRHVTDGFFEDIAVIPHMSGTKDQLWAVVNRTIGGVTKRYIEFFEDGAGFYGQFHSDSGLIYDGVATNEVTGAGHLEGKTVDVLADGSVRDTVVVTSGSITVSGPAAIKIEIGLHYKSTLKTMRPEIALQDGTLQGRKKHWAKIKVRLFKSLGGKINGNQLNFRTIATIMGKPPALFTGDKPIIDLGYDEDGHVEISQDHPLPMIVEAIFGEIRVGD